tara:strand:- start:78051 stop:78194 length:144 start_codon:yes stop_codon:yes gene_type:complete
MVIYIFEKWFVIKLYAVLNNSDESELACISFLFLYYGRIQRAAVAQW